MGRVFDDIMASLNELQDAADGKETGIVKHRRNDDDLVLEYKGYKAKIEYSVDDKVFFGKIEGIKDCVNFECENLDDAEKEFHCAVDDYLAFCKDIGKKPEKPA